MVRYIKGLVEAYRYVETGEKIGNVVINAAGGLCEIGRSVAKAGRTFTAATPEGPPEVPSGPSVRYAIGVGVVDTAVLVPVAAGGSVLPASSRNGGYVSVMRPA